MKLNDIAPRELGVIAAVVALFADQCTKLLMLYAFGFANMQAGENVPVLPFFNLVMVWNPGVSYGLFPAHSALGTAALVLFSFAAIVGLSWWLWHTDRRTVALGLGLVIGGAIGNNLIDRLIYGKVADFFHFHGFGYDWYVFNIADVTITLGVIALLYDALLRPEAQPNSGKSQVE
jgi:signal peptidase II